MLFTSFQFLVLVVVTMGLFYVVPNRRYQVSVLLVASVVFYAFSSLWLTLLLLSSSLFTSYITYGVRTETDPGKRRRKATIGVVGNLLVLSFFKYAGLISQTVAAWSDLSLTGAEWLLLIPLPVGISFYTFQGVSMMVDTYREKEISESSPIPEGGLGRGMFHGVFFIVFFPQLVAGPVVKAKDFLPQIREKFFQDINWRGALHFLVVGYFLKLVVANNLQNQTFWIEFPFITGMSAERCWILLFAYSCQIFADFAGYSSIAIGVALLFGYRLPQNFNFPYFSASIAEFWRRWHISLSSWLKDYLYIPLGGNRRGNIRTYLNLMIVMTLGGLWHGAQWSYLIWGGFHGLLLALERGILRRKVWEGRVMTGLRMTLVFLLVSLAWSFFKLPEISEAALFIKQALFSWTGEIKQKKEALVVAFYASLVFLYHCHSKVNLIDRWRYGREVVYGLMIYTMIVNGNSDDAFIYFQF